MPAYSFEAINPQGQTRKGVIEADTVKSARNQLRAQSLVPLLVEPVGAGGMTDSGSGGGWRDRLMTRPVFNTTGIAIWTRQIAGLAVDNGAKRKGLGVALLHDALARTLQAADIAGIRAVIVHAKDNEARRFYEHFDFDPSPTDPYHLH